MADPTGHNTPTEPPPAAGAPPDFVNQAAAMQEARRLFFRVTGVPYEDIDGMRSTLGEFLGATGLSVEHFVALPATHLEFLGRQLLRARNEETRAVGEYSCEQMADGSAHISATFPPGGIDRARDVLARLGEILLPVLMPMMQDAIGKATTEEPPRRKRRARKTPAATTPAASAPAQAPLDLGAPK